MNTLEPDYVFSQYPKTDADVPLLDEYKNMLSLCDINSALSQLEETPVMTESLLKLFPIYKDEEGVCPGMSIITNFGFMALMLDDDYMDNILVPMIQTLLERDLPADFFNTSTLRTFRSSILEFALLGCKEAQSLMWRLDSQFGSDDEFVEYVAEHRWPNFQTLKRFVVAQNGAGIGVNRDDPSPSTYDTALAEVRAGSKVTHWIWYIFPQMKGIKGTHSRPALYYGIEGRMEAFQYIMHPTLRHRLVEICQAVFDSDRSVYEIFREDTMKVRSCILLFASVSDIPVFRKIITRNNWH